MPRIAPALLNLLLLASLCWPRYAPANDYTYLHVIDVETTATTWTLEFPDEVLGPNYKISGNTDQSVFLPADVYLFQANRPCVIIRNGEMIPYPGGGLCVLQVTEVYSALHYPNPKWRVDLSGYGENIYSPYVVSYSMDYSIGFERFSTRISGEMPYGNNRHYLIFYLLPGVVNDVFLSGFVYPSDPYTSPLGWVNMYIDYIHNGYYTKEVDQYFGRADWPHGGFVALSAPGPPLPARELEFDCWFAH